MCEVGEKGNAFVSRSFSLYRTSAAAVAAADDSCPVTYLLQELGELRRVRRNVPQDLHRNVSPAVGPAVEVAKGSGSDALVADDLGGVELEVVGGRRRAREGRSRDEAVDDVVRSSVGYRAAAAREGAARGARASSRSSDRGQRPNARLGAASRSSSVRAPRPRPRRACSSGRRVGPRRRQLRQPLGQNVFQFIRRLAGPAVDDEDVEREAVERVEGVRLADVEVEVALVLSF